MRLGDLCCLLDDYKNVCKRIKELKNRIRFLEMLQIMMEAKQTDELKLELKELTKLRLQLLNLDTNSACFKCSWNNNQYDFDKTIAMGRCSHCEFDGADQYDNYPDAKETCSGFERKEE